MPLGTMLWGDNNHHLNLGMNMSADNQFTGKANAKQSNSLTGTITVTVARIMPNGTLFVKGERWITINNGRELIRISGIVRSKDIGPDNSIPSQRIADARIFYSGEGSFADSNKPGFLYRIFNAKWWPL